MAEEEENSRSAKKGFPGSFFLRCLEQTCVVWEGKGGGSRTAQSRNGSGGEWKETEKGGVSGRRQKKEEAPSPSLSFAHIAKRATQKIASCGFFSPFFTPLLFSLLPPHLIWSFFPTTNTGGKNEESEGGRPFPSLSLSFLPPSTAEQDAAAAAAAGGEGRGRKGKGRRKLGRRMMMMMMPPILFSLLHPSL